MSGEPEPNITIIVFTRNKQQTTFRKQSLKLIILDNELGKFDNPRGHLKKFVKAEGAHPARVISIHFQLPRHNQGPKAYTLPAVCGDTSLKPSTIALEDLLTSSSSISL